MLSEHARGTIVQPVDKKRAEAAARFVELVSGRYGDVSVEFDARDVSIRITPRPGATVDAVLKLREMARAVALGFAPEQALLLEDENYTLAVIDLKEYVNKPNRLRRIKGRIIGEEGRVKRTIERLASVSVIVGDRHVAILGRLEDVEVARRAIEMLIEGRKHGTAYRYIQSIKGGRR